MNGNGREHQNREKIGAVGGKGRRLSPLSADAVEGAITEKLQRGRADEERFGFAAAVANATPPVDEAFRQTLRDTIVAEAAQTMERQRETRIMPHRGKEVNTQRWYPTLRIAFTLAATAALFAFVFVTPWGRSLAQSALRFFVRTERTTFPLEPSQIVTFVPDASAPTAQPPAPLVTIAEAEREAGFDVAELPFVPEGFDYRGARVYDRAVTIEYEARGGGGSLIIKQSPEGFVQSRWDEVPGHAIVPVKIGEVDGEFARGTFVVYAGDTTATWNPDAPILRMRWVKDGIWFQMTRFGDVEATASLDRARLTELAAAVGARAPVADAGPQLAPEDLDVLVQRLNGEPAPRTVAVFPGNYAAALAERTAHPVVPVAPGVDPSPAAARAAVGEAIPDSGLVDVVLVDQPSGEGASAALVALEQALYRIYRGPGDAPSETFGSLQRIEYLAGPADETLRPIGTTFNNGVELVAAGILDAPRPGEPLPVALEWRADGPVDEPLIVFAHVFCEGSLLAQRDAVPGNGQFPAPGWEPGEVVRDQFALQLPQDLPAGQCQVQVGIYNANTGKRYRPIDSEGEPSIVIGKFSVHGAGETL
jgi:hypothetical protein